MYRVVILSATTDWNVDHAERVWLIAATYRAEEDYFGLVQLLCDTVGIVPGMPFNVEQWDFQVTLNDDERSRLDFTLKAGKEVSGRNWRRDAKSWVMRTVRKVKDVVRT